MKMSLKYREPIADVRRVVVKIGSRVLVQRSGRPDVRRMRHLVRQIAALHRGGKELVVVTSGAIGAGMEALGMAQRPESLPDQQMAAAVGQTRLMSRYDDLFSQAGCLVGQVLLTRANFHQKIRMTNAKRTIENLIRNRVIPIINENDAVADEEIRADMAFGDNDLLAALVVKLIRADLLVMLTPTDGLRSPAGNGRTQRVRYLEEITSKTLSMAGKSVSNLSKGGMASKLRAAQAATRTGCSVVIADGRKDSVLKRVMNGEDVGTLIVA